MKSNSKSPYRVDIVDQFEGHSEDGFSTEGYYPTLKAAIEVARRITEEAISEAGSLERWYGVGDAGLVYDATGTLVWSGTAKYAPKKKSK